MAARTPVSRVRGVVTRYAASSPGTRSIQDRPGARQAAAGLFQRDPVMFFTYLERELRRRMRQAVFAALGLAVGIGLVITVTGAGWWPPSLSGSLSCAAK